MRLKRIIALVSGLGWHVQDLRRAAAVVGVEFEPVPFTRLTASVGDGPARIDAGPLLPGTTDGVLVRMMPPGSLEQVVFRMDALQRLAESGVPVLNPPRAVEAAVDKYLTLAKLDAGGLPVPPTWAGESAAEALLAFDRLGGDVVVKPLFGSEGRGLVRLTDPRDGPPRLLRDRAHRRRPLRPEVHPPPSAGTSARSCWETA